MPAWGGDQRTIEWFTCAWAMDKPIAGTDELLRWVRYFREPRRCGGLCGRRIESPLGVIELVAENYAVELKLPRSADNLDPNVPVRVAGLNPRWSALLWQKDGYIGAGRYGKAQNRFRNLAVDLDGRVYFPIHSGQAPLHHLVVGQAVVADEAGKDLFIEVVCLKDAAGPDPPLWHVSVNNPTDQPVRAKLTRTMDLPGMRWAGEAVDLKPGRWRVVAHPETAMR